MISEHERKDPENSEEGAEGGGGGKGDEPQLQLKILFIDCRTHRNTLFFFYNERKILRIQSCVNP